MVDMSKVHIVEMLLGFGLFLNSVSLIAILYQLRILRIRINELGRR